MMQPTNVTDTPWVITSGSVIPTSIRIIDAVIFALIAFLGITGNTLVFVAYVLSQKIRTKTNIFVVNLAFADFVTCLFLSYISWSLLREIDDVVEPQFDVTCGVVFAAISICVSVSNALLLAIAVNRYVLITRNHQAYKRFYEMRKVVVWLLVSWTFPFVTNLVPLLFGVGHLGFDVNINACGPRTDHEHSYIYDVIVVTTVLPLPFAITICYVGIFLHIRKHNRRMRRYTVSSPNATNYNLQTAAQQTMRGGHSVNKARNREVNLDITKNLFIVLVAYLVCMSPHILSEIIDAPYYIILHTRMLVACNSCLNPIIYGVKHPHFRQVFKCIIFRRWKEIPQPSFDWMKINITEHNRDLDSSTHFSFNTIFSHPIDSRSGI